MSNDTTEDGLSTLFDKLRAEVFEWSVKNFGMEQPPEFPLSGAGEEAGELTTSVLKRAQGIDDSSKYADRSNIGDEAEQDALGDIVIYLADFHARFVSDVGGEPTDDITAILRFYETFGKLCAAVRNDNHERTEQAVDEVMDALSTIAETREFDLDENIIETWEDVSGREWDSEVQTND